MGDLKKGDYVLASKYSDGDPFDGYAVGYFDRIDASRPTDIRYFVVDGDGKQFRANGFRRCERITPDTGNWIVDNGPAICRQNHLTPLNIFRFKYGGQRVRDEVLRRTDQIAASRDWRMLGLEPGNEVGRPQSKEANPHG